MLSDVRKQRKRQSGGEKKRAAGRKTKNERKDRSSCSLELLRWDLHSAGAGKDSPGKRPESFCTDRSRYDRGNPVGGGGGKGHWLGGDSGNRVFHLLSREGCAYIRSGNLPGGPKLSGTAGIFQDFSREAQ